MAKLGFLKGMKRANLANYGDLEGGVTKLKSGRRPITIEDGKCIAWIVGEEDIELSKENVASLEILSSGSRITDLASGGGKPYEVNVYRITMKNGETGFLRLLTGTEYKVLNLIK